MKVCDPTLQLAPNLAPSITTTNCHIEVLLPMSCDLTSDVG